MYAILLCHMMLKVALFTHALISFFTWLTDSVNLFSSLLLTVT